MDHSVALYWIRSERDSGAPDPHGDRILERCRAAAARHGMELLSATADDIVVSHGPDGTAVTVRGTRLSPRTAFFHTKLMSWPANGVDAWRHLTTYAIVEEAGFCVTVPALHSIINNDKLLSCAQDFGPGVNPLPTLRITTRAYQPGRTDFEALGVTFPAIVKPCDWGGGNAVFVADGPRRLDSILALAGAAEMTMAIQPWLGPRTRDVRVYCVGGEPYGASLREAVGAGPAANVAQGGSAGLIPVPEHLAGPARRVARVIGLPYVCVDFLEADGEVWFSEIEVDGGTSAGGLELTAVRFGAYRSHFDRFVAAAAAADAAEDRAPAGVPRWTYA